MKCKITLLTSLVVMLGASPSLAEVPLKHTLEIAQIAETSTWIQVGPVSTLLGHKSAVKSLVFSLDGKVLISGGSDSDPTIVLWSVRDGKEVRRWRAQPTGIDSMVLTKDGTSLVTSGEVTGINFWQWSKENEKAFTIPHTTKILDMKITPDNQILVSASLEGIRVWSIVPERPVYTMTAFGETSYAVAINPDGYTLATGNEQGKVKFWDIRIGKYQSEFSPHKETVSALTYTPDGKKLITGSYDRTIKIWDASTRRLQHTLKGHTGVIRSILLHPNGRILATSSNDGVRLWDIETGGLISVIDAGKDWVSSIAFSKDGRFLAVGYYNGTIKLWQPEPASI